MVAVAAVAAPAPAAALITPPATIAGPASDIVEFGGVAMAPDGSGGVVFTRIVEGVPHVFASRYFGGSWSAPMRVDADQAFEASQPAIAAGAGGELLVVWVTPIATVGKRVRYAVFSAGIGRGASSFGPSLLVDPEVATGSPAGIDPTVSGTATGQAIVGYRAITNRFDGNGGQEGIQQLRPGDVAAETRVARLREDRWARLGAVNVNLEVSTRPPSPANGPKVGAGVDGGAVVAWQESDQSGTARVYLRRIFGTVLGPILQASPSSWEGAPVTGDVDAFALAVTPFNQARVAMRVQGNGPQAPTRLFLNTLPPDFAVPSNALSGEKLVLSVPTANGLGLPGLAAYEKGGQEGLLRLAVVAERRLRVAAVEGSGTLAPLSAPAGPLPVAGSEAGAALAPEGGATVAYPALAPGGAQVVAVRQESAGGAVQTARLTGTQGGPVAGLQVAGSGLGDALIGFRQGEPGRFQIVVDRVSTPPVPFTVKGPKGWVRPGAVKLTWQLAESAVGGLRYAVLLDGRTARSGLLGRQFRPPAAVLGEGVVRAQVMATDALGQSVLSKALRLRVDGAAPTVRVRGPRSGRVTVRIRDGGSGVAPRSTFVRFGDGSSGHGGAVFRHAYARRGRYRIVVRASDRAGNGTRRSFEVRVR